MKKFWIVYVHKNTSVFKHYDTYQEAEDEAKRLAYDIRGNEYVILEATATTKQPVPNIDIVKLL